MFFSIDENEVDEIHEFVLHSIFCDDEGQSGVDWQSTNREGCSTSTIGTTESKSNELSVCEDRDRLIETRSQSSRREKRPRSNHVEHQSVVDLSPDEVSGQSASSTRLMRKRVRFNRLSCFVKIVLVGLSSRGLTRDANEHHRSTNKKKTKFEMSSVRLSSVRICFLR